jgi:hypothetical protein
VLPVSRIFEPVGLLRVDKGGQAFGIHDL